MTRITLFVKPNSASVTITYDQDRQAFLISVTSPPDKGKANKELLKILKKRTHVTVALVSGLTATTKILEIPNLTLEQIKERLLTP